MKRLVDLTEEGKFSKPEIDPVMEELLKVVEDLSRNNKIKPWDWENHKLHIMGLDKDYYKHCYSDKELLFTGDREEREVKKHHKTVHDGLICKECNSDYSNKPWLMDFGECIVCNESYHKTPTWRSI